jgi:lipoprotein-releasing system permease protein
MLRSAGGVSGAILRGVALEKRSAFDTLADRLPWEASAAASDAPPPIFLGKELARNLGAEPQDVVFLIAPGGSASGLQSNPAMLRFTVAGLVDSGMHEFDKHLAFTNLQDAQQAQGAGDAVTGVEVKVADIYAADRVAQRIADKVGFPFWARDWMRMNHNLFLNLKLQKTVMFIILTLIVLVAAFNIASTLIMMVMEKTKDIAILKAMGATDRSIRKIFVFKGMSIGAVGTLVGSGLGFVLCRLLGRYQIIDLPADVYYFSKLPVQLEWPDVLVITAATMLICFLATLYPSHKAARLNPVETIRYTG